MKKIFILLAILALFLNGCKKDFDPKLYGTLATSTFPSNETEFKLYTMELYKPFQARWGYSGTSGYWENNFFCPEYGHIAEFDMSTDLMPVYTNWGGFWEGFSSTDFTFLKTQDRTSHFEKVRMVTQATKIIYDLENSSINQTVKTGLIAEAKMARGWIMYYLLHMYGPVPVILDASLIGTSAEADLTKPSRADFVKWIGSDLRYAADTLSRDADNYGRFNKGCALTVLMRLYLNEKDFVSAESVGREILLLGYSLVSDYTSLFKEATEVNSETIWAVSCTNGSTGNFNALAYYCLPTKYKEGKVQGGWGGNSGVMTLNWKIYDSFESSDERKKCLVASYTDDNSKFWDRNNMNGAIINKYPAEGGSDNSLQGNDIVICRYADVLLMLAEAINENSGPTTEAVGYLNNVRGRSKASLVTDAEKVSKTTFRDALFIERGKELFLEGLRKMDLIRMDKTSSALTSSGKTVGPNFNVFPLPTYAINNSNGTLVQNTGY